LGDLEISKNQHGPLFVNNAGMELPLKEVPPISQNIKSFQKIIIRFAFHFSVNYIKMERTIWISQDSPFFSGDNFGLE
jgi:hypothetical protein